MEKRKHNITSISFNRGIPCGGTTSLFKREEIVRLAEREFTAPS
jgi:hypothetical protein